MNDRDADHDALLAAIIADPEDDTLRLAFADKLDELGGTANSERAEFIRLHFVMRDAWRDQATRPDHAALCERVHLLRWRYQDEWAVCPCPAPNHSDSYECPICHNTKNLFRDVAHNGNGKAIAFPLVLDWGRGFPYQIYCSLAYAFVTITTCPLCLGGPPPPNRHLNDRCPGCGDVPFVPRRVISPWAKGVVAGSPVTRISPDIRPTASSRDGRATVWSFHSGRDSLPPILFNEMVTHAKRDSSRYRPWGGNWDADNWLDFGSEDEAKFVMATAVGTIARRANREEISRRL